MQNALRQKWSARGGLSDEPMVGGVLSNSHAHFFTVLPYPRAHSLTPWAKLWIRPRISILACLVCSLQGEGTCKEHEISRIIRTMWMLAPEKNQPQTYIFRTHFEYDAARVDPRGAGSGPHMMSCVLYKFVTREALTVYVTVRNIVTQGHARGTDCIFRYRRASSAHEHMLLAAADGILYSR